MDKVHPYDLPTDIWPGVQDWQGLNTHDIFPQETKLIKHTGVRYVLDAIFRHVPKHFKDQPSSSTGKYHPEDEFAPGGNILHTKRVVRVMQHLCVMHNIEGTPRDILIAACLIHDTGQYGWEAEPSAFTVHGHELVPYYMTEEYLGEMTFYHDILGVAVRHSGRWGPDLLFLLNTEKGRRLSTTTLHHTVVKLMHTADFMASRREILVDITKGLDGK